MRDFWRFGWFTNKRSQVNPDVRVFESFAKVECLGGAASVNQSLKFFFDSFHLGAGRRPSVRERWFDLVEKKVISRCDYAYFGSLKKNVLQTEEIRGGLVIADYGQGLISPGFLKSIAALYPDLPVVCSPHISTCEKMPENFRILNKNWVWVMNGAEHGELSPTIQFPYYIVTHGDGNIVIVRNEKIVGRVAPTIVEALHTVGIGDVFLSAFSSAYFRKKSLDFCVKFAQAMASQVLKARRFETCRITQNDINALYKENSSEGLGAGGLADQPA